MYRFNLWLAAACVAAIACGDSSRQSAAAVVVDTLPGGIPRTMSSAPVDAGRWHLEPARVIQPEEETDGELTHPQSVAIANDGSVVVADIRPVSIKVYGPDGQFRHAFGREGAGPGEFRTAVVALRGDTLVVQDPSNARVTTFDWRTGRLLHSTPSACCFSTPVAVDEAGRAWLRTTPPSRPDSSFRFVQGWLRVSLASGARDTLYAYERADLPEQRRWSLALGRTLMRVAVPMSPQVYFAVDSEGRVISGWSGEYSLRVSRDGRDTLALFGRRWSPQAIGEEEKTRHTEARVEEVRRLVPPAGAAARAAFDRSHIPGTRPAFDAIYADAAGRRWVLRNEADTTASSFDLFGADGRWLDSLRLPRSVWPGSPSAPLAFGAREIAAVMEGEDGRPLVRVFTIRRR